MRLDFDPKAVVQAAIKSGLLKPATPNATVPKPPRNKLSAKVLKLRKRARTYKIREARKAAGLHTMTGKPLVRKKHPELAGFSRRKYLRLYARKMRGLTKEANK